MKTKQMACAVITALAVMLSACNPGEDILLQVHNNQPKRGARIATRTDPLFGNCSVRTDLIALDWPANVSVSAPLPGITDFVADETSMPAGCGTPQAFGWTSSDTTRGKVIALDSITGRVTSVAIGNTNICAAGQLRTNVSLCFNLPVGTAVVVPGCSVTGVGITQPATTTIVAGGNVQLSALVTSNPVGCAPSTVTWTAVGVGTVNGVTGLVTSNAGIGVITVTARSTFDTTRTGNIVITVSTSPATITGFSMAPKPIVLTVGQTQMPIITVNLSDNTTLTGVNAQGRFSCLSRNTAMVTVNAVTCQITAVAVGSAYVVGTTTSPAILTDSILVSVSSTPQVFVMPPSFVLHRSAGCPTTFQPLVTLIGVTGPVKWSITNHGAASVDTLTGLTTGLAVGVDTITATPVNAPTIRATTVVTVDNLTCANPIVITFTVPADTGVSGTFGLITANVIPVGTELVYFSSDPSRVSIIGSNITFAVATGGWPAGFHKAGETHYLTKGTVQITVFAKANPAFSASILSTSK